MKSSAFYKMIAISALLAASGCTYDNIIFLNQNEVDSPAEETCSASNCDKPENPYVSIRTGRNSSGECTCEYVCTPGYVSDGTETGIDLKCIEKCKSNTQCMAQNSATPICDSDGRCVSNSENTCDCNNEQYCDKNNTCKEKQENGKPCSDPNECKSGYCDDNSKSCADSTASETCEMVTCPPVYQENAYNKPDPEDDCKCKMHCRSGYLEQKDQNGELVCEQNLQTGCSSDKDCLLMNSENPYPWRCLNVNDAEGRCVECLEDLDCKNHGDGISYKSSYCSVQSGYTCVAKKVKGDSCNNSDECDSGLCFGNQCSEIAPQPKPCKEAGENAECGENQFCNIKGGCQDKKEAGSGCQNNYECKSNHCNDNKCTFGTDECIQCDLNREYCDRNTSTCVQKKGAGADCSAYGNGMCLSNSCMLNDGNSICACDGGKNSPCLFPKECINGICVSQQATECQNDSECLKSKPYCSNHQCVEIRIDGDACNSAEECATKICSNGRCSDACKDNSDCLIGYTCDKNNECIDKIGSLLGGENCEKSEQCASGLCDEKSNRCHCQTDNQGVLVGCNAPDEICNASQPCNSESVCTGACVIPKSLAEGAVCGVDDACKSGVCNKSNEERCTCINGSYRYNNVLQRCENFKWNSAGGGYYYDSCTQKKYIITINYSDTGKGYMEYSVNDNDPGVCNKINDLINSDVSENIKISGSNSGGVAPMCYVHNDKSFEIYYNDVHRVWQINRCNNDCNSNFTSCHQSIYNSSNPCRSDILDMKLFVDNVIWTENKIGYISNVLYTSGIGNVCKYGKMQFVSKCTIEFDNLSASECQFSSEIESICIDFYNQTTFEKRSFSFKDVRTGINAPNRMCAKGCNDNYDGCK